jgi:predicted RNase H-like nuclease (RuvC/YqgF family)
MSDQGKFINTYIDVIIGTVHETLNSNLQLKTQLKLSNDLLAEKDAEIKKYQSIIDDMNKNKEDFSAAVQTNQSEIENLKSQLSRNQQECETYKSKASHTDALLQQIVSMKQEVRNRDIIIAEKEKELADIKAKENELRVKKTKTVVKSLEAAELNNVKDNVLKSKDDF